MGLLVPFLEPVENRNLSFAGVCSWDRIPSSFLAMVDYLPMAFPTPGSYLFAGAFVIAIVEKQSLAPFILRPVLHMRGGPPVIKRTSCLVPPCVVPPNSRRFFSCQLFLSSRPHVDPFFYKANDDLGFIYF